MPTMGTTLRFCEGGRSTQWQALPFDRARLHVTLAFGLDHSAYHSFWYAPARFSSLPNASHTLSIALQLLLACPLYVRLAIRSSLFTNLQIH